MATLATVALNYITNAPIAINCHACAMPFRLRPYACLLTANFPRSRSISNLCVLKHTESSTAELLAPFYYLSPDLSLLGSRWLFALDRASRVRLLLGHPFRSLRRPSELLFGTEIGLLLLSRLVYG